METRAEAVRAYGEVFTRQWVVIAILDLIGYTEDADLAERTIIEPACGSGAFLVPIVERLVAAARRTGVPFDELGGCVRAYDLQSDHVDHARKRAAEVLLTAGCSREIAERLVADWIHHADFLLDDEPVCADFAAGNPPYIRLEALPKALLTEYRRKWRSMKGRADVYIGFIERMLQVLAPDGRVGFICADRWMRNEYGAPLRKIISDGFAVEHIWSMHHVDAFESAVTAYPAITVLRHRPQQSVSLVTCESSFGEREARRATRWALGGTARVDAGAYRGFRQSRWPSGGAPWPSASVARLRVLSQIQRAFAPLEDPATGTALSIGVATGDDDVYIRADAPVERARLLPLVMADDLVTGEFVWGRRHLVNPWDDQGLVDLARWPRLRRYYERHRDAILDRNVARKSKPDAWYRTIDRVRPGLADRPKLVLPEMKAAIHPVLVPAGFYPHHNVYYVVSDTWDLEVLGGLLLSRVAQAFVEAYCVRMRGETLRFQAQYLRQIHVPDQASLAPAVRRALRTAFRRRDADAATAAALRAYGLDSLPD